jgi:Caspase domain
MSRLLTAAVAAVWALIALPLSTDAALAQKRVALVVGNGSYQNVPKLPNPLKDAVAVGEMFKKAGFDWVKVRQDVGNLDFKRALREFMDAATDADIAVVYYAGHGIQVKDMNYMIPVDAKLATEIDAEDEAVSLDRIVAALEPAKRLRLVILDACRDNPFQRTMKRRVAMRAISGGLAKMEPTLGDTLIAYAAKAGSTAEDGEGENSPFASALMKHLAVPGLDVRLAFGRIRDDVLKSTAYKQEPFVYGSLGGEAISIVPAPAQPKAAPVADVQRDFDLVKQINSKRAWEIFIETHKTGLHVELAKEELKKLGGGSAPVTVAAVEPVKTPKPAEPSSDERRAWDRIKDTGDRGKLRDFIAKYPSSPLAETAQNRLTTLDRAAQEREDKARADRDAAKQREEEARLAKAAEAERNLALKNDRAQGEACKRDEERLARLRPSAGQGWAREDLKRLERETTCAGIRSEVVALLAQPPADTARQPTTTPEEQPANAPALVRSAQAELRRIGCFAGRDDGNLNSATKEAIVRYLSTKGESAKDIKVTEGFVASLKDQSGPICPLTCSRGEHAEGDRCVADAKPEKKEKPKATARQRDEDEDRPARRAKPQREEPRREAARPKPERKAERSKPERQQASRPQPARSQASRSGGGGGMVGVGF